MLFEAILSPSERYQTIQNNHEYNSVLPFRIILKIFAVNMLDSKKTKLGSSDKKASPVADENVKILG